MAQPEGTSSREVIIQAFPIHGVQFFTVSTVSIVDLVRQENLVRRKGVNFFSQYSMLSLQIANGSGSAGSNRDHKKENDSFSSNSRALT